MDITNLNRAIELASIIKEKENALGALTYKVNQRKRDIDKYKNGYNGYKWIPCENWFCKGTIKDKLTQKVTLDAPREFEYPLHFELDDECVEFIIQHEREKIDKLNKELEEL